MLYILGGSSRSGKSIISRRITSERKIPFFCLDFLVTSLQEVNTLDIKHGQPFVIKAKKMWPYVKPLLLNLIKEEPNYLIEGDGILPSQVSKLSKAYPNEIRACFVGFSEIDLQKKFKQVKKFGRQKDNWTEKVSDKKLLSYLKDMIDFSKYLNDECNKYNLPYFDCSSNFNTYIERVFLFLSDKRS